MSADQGIKFAHQLILFTNAFLHLIFKQKLALATGRTMNRAVRRLLI